MSILTLQSSAYLDAYITIFRVSFNLVTIAPLHGRLGWHIHSIASGVFAFILRRFGLQDGPLFGRHFVLTQDKLIGWEVLRVLVNRAANILDILVRWELLAKGRLELIDYVRATRFGLNNIVFLRAVWTGFLAVLIMALFLHFIHYNSLISDAFIRRLLNHNKSIHVLHGSRLFSLLTTFDTQAQGHTMLGDISHTIISTVVCCRGLLAILFENFISLVV